VQAEHAGGECIPGSSNARCSTQGVGPVPVIQNVECVPAPSIGPASAIALVCATMKGSRGESMREAQPDEPPIKISAGRRMMR
jgi:hypothetical protein